MMGGFRVAPGLIYRIPGKPTHVAEELLGKKGTHPRHPGLSQVPRPQASYCPALIAAINRINLLLSPHIWRHGGKSAPPFAATRPFFVILLMGLSDSPGQWVGSGKSDREKRQQLHYYCFPFNTFQWNCPAESMQHVWGHGIYLESLATVKIKVF